MCLFKKLTVVIFYFWVSGCATTLSSTENQNKKTALHHLDLAQNLLKSKRSPEAIAELKKAYRLDPKNEDISHQMALALVDRNAYQLAVKYFRKSLALNPQSTEIRNNFIKTLLSLKKNRTAYRLARKSISDLTYPQPQESHYLFALSAEKLNKNREAEVYFKKILTQNKFHCGANYHLSKTLYKKRDLKKTFVLLNRALSSCTDTGDKEKAQKAFMALKRKLVPVVHQN